MNQNLVKQHLDEVLLFVLDVRLFHGNRKLRPDDLADALQVAVAQDEVFTLGVKRVFDKDFVNKLNRVKSGMERACARVGTPFLGGFAIPQDKADELAAELETFVVKGSEIKADILANFAVISSEYAQRHQKWEDVIKRNSFSETYVRDRIHFGWRAIKVSAGREDGLIGQGLADEVGGLLGSLLTSVAKAARRFIEDSLTGRDAVTRKALRPIIAAREKLEGFGFLDQRVRPLCTVIDRLIASMPSEGRIEDMHLSNLIGMATILTNPGLALEVGDKAVSEDADQVFEQFFQTQQMVAQAAPALEAPLATEATAGMLESNALTQVPVISTTPLAPAIGGMPALMVPALAPVNVDFGNLFG